MSTQTVAVNGDAILEARRQRGYSRTALGYLVGVDQMTIGRWERGQTPTTDYETLARLAGILGVDMDQLVAESSREAVAS